jgi:hypothetical protein
MNNICALQRLYYVAERNIEPKFIAIFKGLFSSHGLREWEVPENIKNTPKLTARQGWHSTF